LAKVKLEQRPLVFFAEFIVYRQVAQVEETVAHPAILPVNDAHHGPVVDKVARQKIVVARTRRIVSAQILFDLRQSFERALKTDRELDLPFPRKGVVAPNGGEGRKASL